MVGSRREEIELSGIKGYYRVQSALIEEVDTYYNDKYGYELTEEMVKSMKESEYDIVKEKKVTILLKHNISNENNIVIVRYYGVDEFKNIPEAPEEIALKVVNSMVHWDAVSDNLGRGLIELQQIPYTTTDMVLYEKKYVKDISEYHQLLMDVYSEEFMDNSALRFKYKQYKQIENDRRYKVEVLEV